MRPDRIIKEKWRILDEKVESDMDHKFGAPRLSPSLVSIS
jgi:hypothetical protein